MVTLQFLWFLVGTWAWVSIWKSVDRSGKSLVGTLAVLGCVIWFFASLVPLLGQFGMGHSSPNKSSTTIFGIMVIVLVYGAYWFILRTPKEPNAKDT
jgi:hypothetical protein